jgi:hypothetical protein
MQMAIDRVAEGLDHGSDLVWGGDWNQTLHGRVITQAGGDALSKRVGVLGLKVPTAVLAHTRDAGWCTIDHIAVPDSWNVTSASRLVARSENNTRLSDHDAYVVEVER